MPDTILVTGGAGFVGTNLVRALVARGERVRVIDSGSAAGVASLAGLDVALTVADIREGSALDAAVMGVDLIVHLAAQTSVPASIADPGADFDVNVLGSVAVLEAARAHQVGRLVFASSNAVVAGHPSPVHEGLVPRPVAPYGAAKATAEAYLAAYRRAYGIESVALRFANAYGPWSAHKSSVVPNFVRTALSDQPLVIRGDGSQTRDFVHVDDVVAAICACLDARADALEGGVFQVGTGIETSVSDLANAVLAATGSRGGVVHEVASPGDVARNFSEIGRAQQLLGYRPAVSLDDGIRQTVEWFSGRAS